MILTLSDGWLMYIYSTLGSFVVWGRLALKDRQSFSYADVFDKVFKSKNIAYLAQFFVFVLIGGLVAKTLASPATAPQALAAGMAWSRLTGKV
ncbi:hypothetical protein [Sphingomonas sp. BK481]|jgi:hypothetical protein|uniref:hypothetical protein n=1 Tax=Sphingomonas sp. BK481 TaxID=2586981 RepID=UPI00160A4112|nr:hypothetical protein [Sphingomonas sp. BK481]MBB3585415.1 hypothetical protein [Sphingomonas sp. BK481]